ncbi:MAG: hypothetical protein KF861_09110 [Planctomycetaceae bacterium]|nr:hypothetical protein [Planctomycetaceae bacterium]
MHARFLPDGESRRRQSQEFRDCVADLRASIQARYAAELVEAGFLRRLILRWKVAAEFRKERKKLELPPQTLYSSQPGILD